MMRFLLFLIIIYLFNSCQTKPVADLNFTNAHVVNVKTGIISLQTISISGDSISHVGNDPPKAKKTLDLRGKYVIPPLWDMHVHTQGEDSILKKFSAYGISGIRDMGTFSDEATIKLKKASLNPIYDYPNIRYAGRLHSDTICSKNHKHISTYADVKASIEYNLKHKAEFYKVHNCYPQQMLPLLDILTQQNHLKIVGHIPEGIDPIDYLKFYKVSSVEHISIPLRGLSFRISNALSMKEGIRLLDGTYLDSLADIMVDKKVAFSPNLRSEIEFINSYPKEMRHLGDALYSKYQKYTKRFIDKGVLILAASDYGVEGIQAGVSLHEELELLRDAGLSNLEALQSATLNPIKYLNNNYNPNILAPGCKGDFLILNKNPLEDIRFTRDFFGLVKTGKVKFF